MNPLKTECGFWYIEPHLCGIAEVFKTELMYIGQQKTANIVQINNQGTRL